MTKVVKVTENLKEVDKKICEIENLLNELKPKDSIRLKQHINSIILNLNEWQTNVHTLVNDPAFMDKKQEKTIQSKICFEITKADGQTYELEIFSALSTDQLKGKAISEAIRIKPELENSDVKQIKLISVEPFKAIG